MKTHWDIYEENQDFMSRRNILEIRDKATVICKELEQSYKNTGNGHSEFVWNAVAILADAADRCFQLLREEYGGQSDYSHHYFLKTSAGTPHLKCPIVKIENQQ